MLVNPGALNKRISIVQPTIRADDNGYPVMLDTVVHTCFAQFSRTSGKEAARENADFGILKCRFLIRYTSKEIDRKMYVRYCDRKYPIVYVNDYGDAHEYIEIWCEVSTQEAVL